MKNQNHSSRRAAKPADNPKKNVRAEGLSAVQASILRCLQQSPSSLTARSLMKQLRTSPGEGRKLFFRALNELESQGKVETTRKGRLVPVKKDKGFSAEIVSLSRFFAFARPEDGGDDIFIPAEKLRGAVTGDTVRLTGLRQEAKGPTAEVASVVKRRTGAVTGTIRAENGAPVFQPDIAIRYGLPVAAKSLAVKDGEKAQAELCRGKNSGGLEARVVKIYGNAGSAKVCADAILDGFGIAARFSGAALAEAEASASRGISEEDLRGRLDLRDEPICTIDGADAKDLDDAISVGRTRAGGYRLGVHIADVSHYVAPDGVLDLEARSRGTSVYFADRVVPMLPESLSNGACSLGAGEDKLAFSALLELDGSGKILSYRFRKSVIRSKVRGVYSEVNSIFAGTADRELRKKYFPVVRSLRAARELAGVLQKRFSAGGTIDLETRETAFALDANGVCTAISPRRSGEAERMIESLMISANCAAAMLARSAGIPFVYRVHEQPDPERVETLIRLAEAAGLDASPLKRGKGKLTPADFSALLEEAKDTPAGAVISHQVLRTMAKARYSTEPLGHFGLALEDYCHFTSPIRRYPDTSVHRILSALVSGKNGKALAMKYASFAEESARSSSEAEVRAMSAERSAEDCYMAEYASQHIGEIQEGLVSGVTMRGVFVELPDTLEGFVSMESFPGADYRFDGALSQRDAKTGARITIGTPLRVRLIGADVASGRIDFAFAEE